LSIPLGYGRFGTTVAPISNTTGRIAMTFKFKKYALNPILESEISFEKFNTANNIVSPPASPPCKMKYCPH
tara:strand:- start:225 stop:437 length:213 start_codon:yes stop_codon:yes gene_type:complete